MEAARGSTPPPQRGAPRGHPASELGDSGPADQHAVAAAAAAAAAAAEAEAEAEALR